MVYHNNVIYTTCGATVLLKFVESFIFDKGSEKLVIDKLMDDFCFNIRTISGQEYRISTKLNSELLGSHIASIPEVAQAVYDKWKFIHQEK
jgi:hypothetical protein